VRPGSHMYFLLRLLSVSGEFPSKSLGILGDVRTIKAMIHKMEAVQKIRLYSNNTVIETKLFQLSGKSDKRTIRLTKNALSILNEIHPDALSYYLSSFPDNRFTGDQFRIWRNHRVGEVIAMCMMAGVETAPYILPELQKDSIRRVITETPGYYIARNFKKIYEAELNKTVFTRVIGLLFYPHGCYAVYNTRDAVMKWSGMGEIKARQELSEIVRMNAGLNEVTSVLLFGASDDIALRTLIESDKSQKRQIRFDRIYQSIHFIPLNQNGINLLKILTLPDWHEKLMSVLFAAELRKTGYGSIEFDASWENKYYYSYLDSDIARLIRFKETPQNQLRSFEIICFPWQTQFLKDYLGKSVLLREFEMPAVLKALGIIN
jgi:hypothetical protein